MSNAVFPTFPGLDWNVKRIPTFGTLAQAASNGMMVRIPRFLDPMWQFECSFEFLRDTCPNDEFNALLGFFLARQGGYDSFLLDLSTLTQNPADAFVEGQLLSLDGNNCAPLARSLGQSGNLEQIYELQGPPVVRDGNGNVLAAGTAYTLYCSCVPPSGVGTFQPYNGLGGYYLQFASAPKLPVTADFGWYYRVIFSAGKGSAQDPQIGNDQQEFAALWYAMYEARQITLVTARE
jgi:hypothetical protein